jgi:hypothetical protein
VGVHRPAVGSGRTSATRIRDGSGDVISFVEKHRYGSGHTEQDLLRTSWEGEIFGTALCEEIARSYPEYADPATAGATMEWFNVHRCEEFGHETGVSVTLEKAEKLGREGAELVRKHSFKTVAKMTAAETPASDKMYDELAKITKNPELKAFAGHLADHENALRDWLKSEVDGKSDGGEKIFAYLERYDISDSNSCTSTVTVCAPNSVTISFRRVTQSVAPVARRA